MSAVVYQIVEGEALMAITDILVNEALDTYVETISSIDGVIQIYLFGSFAYGTPDEDSDIDLMVVVEDGLKSSHIANRISTKLINKRTVPLDLLVNGYSYFNSAADSPTLQSLIRREGVLLYDRN